MHIVTFRVPSSAGSGWSSILSQAFPREGQVQMIHVPTEFLVSPGQYVSVGVSVHTVETDVEPGEFLLRRDARGIAGVVITQTWDCGYIPSERFLWQIMQDITEHGWEHPSHGPSCVCMDHFAREIKLHISKGIPPDTGQNGDVRYRVDARQRVAYVLRMVQQWL